MWMLVFILMDKPAESLAGIATLIVGLIVYFFAIKNKQNKLHNAFGAVN